MSDTEAYTATVYNRYDMPAQPLGILTQDAYYPTTAAPATTAYPGEYANRPLNRCSPDSHRFACKHESHCECGRTMRLMDTVLTEGL